MQRRDLSKAIVGIAAVSGAGALTEKAQAQTCTAPCYAQTAAEAAVGVTPTNYAVPSHAVTGEVYPQRYGAQFANTDDTIALQNAFNVGQQAICPVVMPGGVALINTTLLFGSNSSTGQSGYPPGLRGSGVGTLLKAASGFNAGTLLAAKGISGAYLRDFLVDGNGLAAVCIDTSWPGTVGPSANNEYLNLWAQNFTQNGHLAINDNQSSWKDCVYRQPTGNNLGVSALRAEGPGGSLFFDNVTCNGFLSVTCQNASIRGGYMDGVRINESTNGLNSLNFDGGTQIYCNPVQNCHFYDANYSTPGHTLSDLVANGIYLISNSGSGTTNTFACAISNKVVLNGAQWVAQVSYAGTWNVYLPGLTQPYYHFSAPSILELNGGFLGYAININTPSGYVTQRRDSAVTGTGLLTDFPMRVIYRNTLTFSSGLAANTWASIVPAAEMTEVYASYILCVNVANPGVDQLAVQIPVSSVAKSGSLAATPALNIPLTANYANSSTTGQIFARYGNTASVSGGWYAGVDIAISEALVSGATIGVSLIRLANPSVNY